MFPTHSGSFGQCSGAHCVWFPMILCRAPEAAWAFGRNSIAPKAPPLVTSVIVAPLSAPSLSYWGEKLRPQPSVLKLYCVSGSLCVF